jgi:UDP-2-acetamido-2,6-beta-L-arabino-hexul-4-ose reductase
MNILVTGSKGFVGKNLIAELKNRQYMDICEYDADTDPDLLDEYCRKADFVFHLAGVNRPQVESDFMKVNFGFTSTLLESLKQYHNPCPIMISSSIQATLENTYGSSKKAGEELILSYGRETGAVVLVYRFPNIFGKWCRPNYNSAVATFCHNVAHDLPIEVLHPDRIMNLTYIDDVVEELIHALKGSPNKTGNYCQVPVVYFMKLGDIANLIQSFKETRKNLGVPNMSDGFIKKLYSTYLSYLPPDQFSYALHMNKDQRGSFTEFIKTPDRGQVSVNIIKPGITKGNHWHHTKTEKFLVVSGRGLIRFRNYGSDEVLEYLVSADRLEVIDIPTGYSHSIENLGEEDMVAIIWGNEQLDPQKPDTHDMEV